MRRWHWLTREERAHALALARANPDRSWSDIARELGLAPKPVIRHLRRVLGDRRATPRWREAVSRAKARPMPALPTPTSLSCPACLQPLPPIPAGAGYRCPCGHLIATSRAQGAA